MKLWTIQTKQAFEVLMEKGELSATLGHQWSECPQAYSWMERQMEIRLPPRKTKSQKPLWAWAQWRNALHRKPDLRSVRHDWRPDGDYVLIEMFKQPEEVLLSDYGAWHFVLNNWYLGVCGKAQKAFDQKLKDHKHEIGKEYPSELMLEVMKSWEVIFDLDALDGSYFGRTSCKELQATFWTLKEDEVLSYKYFTSKASDRF